MIRSLVVGITGASGAIYAKRFLEIVAGLGLDIGVIASKPGMRILLHELGKPQFGPPSDPRSWLNLPAEARARMGVFPPSDIGAGPASGTYGADAMAIVPCSMRTLAMVAHGFADNLIGRAADVMIKERRPLVLVPRETPLSAIHLENMLKLSRLGVSIVPAMPGFYHLPMTIDELVELQVQKIMASLGLDHPNAFEWKGMEE